MIITKTFHTSKPESLIDDLPYRYFPKTLMTNVKKTLLKTIAQKVPMMKYGKK